MAAGARKVKSKVMVATLSIFGAFYAAQQCQAAYVFTEPNSFQVAVNPNLPSCSLGNWEIRNSNSALTNNCYNAYGPYGSLKGNCFYSDGYGFFRTFGGGAGPSTLLRVDFFASAPGICGS